MFEVLLGNLIELNAVDCTRARCACLYMLVVSYMSLPIGGTHIEAVLAPDPRNPYKVYGSACALSLLARMRDSRPFKFLFQASRAMLTAVDIEVEVQLIASS